jgi:hypothetical protein
MHLQPGSFESIVDLDHLYRNMLKSLKNRSMMANVIGPVEIYDRSLFEFCPDKVLDAYKTDWSKLSEQLFFDRKGAIDKVYLERKQNLFAVFAKGCLSAARFITTFDSPEDFRKKIDQIISMGPTSNAAKFIVKEVSGMGFALSCDFLKGCGWTQFSKPDVHLIKIFVKKGLSGKTDLEVFNAIQDFANIIGITPYEVDKVFWLIGSGNLHLVKKKFKTSIDEFIVSAA